MASSSANWSNIKTQKQHQLQLASGLTNLNANNDPFPIDVSYFHKLVKFPHQHAEPVEAGIAGKDERELSGYRQYLFGFAPNGKDITEESIKFCTQTRCTYASVKNGLETLERGYRLQACKAAQYHVKHPVSECDTMVKYLNKWSVDKDNIPKTDSKCYNPQSVILKKKNKDGDTVSVIEKLPCETQFYRDYKALRNDTYKYLRASIPLYLDTQANTVLKSHIADLERRKTPPLTDYDKITDVKRRVKYSEIKKFILKHLTMKTPGSFFFKSLLCASRSDGTTILPWCDDIETRAKSIIDHGRGWEKVVDREAVIKLWDWTGKEERKLIRQAFADLPRVHGGVTSKSIVNEESLESILDVIRNIERTTWPETPFKSSWCVEGKKKLIYTHQQYQGILDEFNKLKNKYKQLSTSYDEFKKNNKTTNKKRDRDPDPNPTKGNKPKEQPPNKKTKTPVCKACMRAGLGKRAHKTEDCNEELRNKAVAAKKRRELQSTATALNKREKTKHGFDD